MNLVWQTPPRRLGVLDLYLALAAVAALVARFFPMDFARSVYTCPLFALTDVPCLTCGMTRSWHRLANLEVASAFMVSPLGAVLFLGVLAFVGYGLLRLVMGWPWPRLSLSRRDWWIVRFGLFGVIAGNWLFILWQHRVAGTWG